MNYTHLAHEERYQIYALKKAGHDQKSIAKVLGRHPATISRELGRNSGSRGYRPKQAQRLSEERRAVNARCIDEFTWQLVDEKLQEQWSPDQISGHVLVSHETIYQHIYADKAAGGLLWKHLRCQKKRRKRYGKAERRGQIPNRQSIEKRPAEVDERRTVGHWEADTIIGRNHKQALVSVVERKSGVVRLRKVRRRTAELVGLAMVEMLKPYGAWVDSITADNGKEFAGHETIGKSLGADFYFAHPYCSWERGTNENTNGLVRQYFPKGMDFRAITDEEVQAVEDRLNNRPRKRHGYLTPNQVFFKSTIALQI
jgi:IS30 family transposase